MSSMNRGDEPVPVQGYAPGQISRDLEGIQASIPLSVIEPLQPTTTYISIDLLDSYPLRSIHPYIVDKLVERMGKPDSIPAILLSSSRGRIGS
jgi:hypothetical protein